MHSYTVARSMLFKYLTTPFTLYFQQLLKCHRTRETPFPSPTSNFWLKAFPTSNFLKTHERHDNDKGNASHRS